MIKPSGEVVEPGDPPGSDVLLAEERRQRAIDLLAARDVKPEAKPEVVPPAELVQAVAEGRAACGCLQCWLPKENERRAAQAGRPTGRGTCVLTQTLAWLLARMPPGSTS